MDNFREIYADEMVSFAVHPNGSVAKIIVVSKNPDSTGKFVETNRTALVMPIAAMQEMLNDIQNVIGQPRKSETKN